MGMLTPSWLSFRFLLTEGQWLKEGEEKERKKRKEKKVHPGELSEQTKFSGDGSSHTSAGEVSANKGVENG